MLSEAQGGTSCGMKSNGRRPWMPKRRSPALFLSAFMVSHCLGNGLICSQENLEAERKSLVSVFKPNPPFDLLVYPTFGPKRCSPFVPGSPKTSCLCLRGFCQCRCFNLSVTLPFQSCTNPSAMIWGTGDKWEAALRLVGHGRSAVARHLWSLWLRACLNFMFTSDSFLPVFLWSFACVLVFPRVFGPWLFYLCFFGFLHLVTIKPPGHRRFQSTCFL